MAAKDTIEAIREAEIASQDKEREARAEAARLVENAKAEAKKMLFEKVTGFKDEDEKAAAEAAKESAALVAQAEQDVGQEISALRERAGKNEKAAVDAVLKRLTA